MAFDRSRALLPLQRSRLLTASAVPNFSSSLLQGLSYLRRFDRRSMLMGPDYIYGLPSGSGNATIHDGSPMVLQSSADYKGGPAGAGLSPYAVLANANATYSVPLQGTLLAFVTAGFSPTDGVQHYICSFGQDSSYPGGPALDFLKFSDNKWYFGFFTGSDTRVSGNASGTFASGDTFVAGGTWNSSATKLYVKGVLQYTNSTNSNASNTAGFKICFGGGNTGAGPGTNPWSPNQPMTSALYWIAVWSRLLTPGEILEISLNPSVLFTYPTQTFVPLVGVIAAAAGSKQAAVTVIT
jgi:hypothetical protein